MRWLFTLCALFVFRAVAHAGVGVAAESSQTLPVQHVIYPAPEGPNDHRFDDLVEFLRMALERTVAQYGPYTLAPSTVAMNEARYLDEVRRGSGLVNLIWSSTSQERERELLPIRISLRKDLLGYRIALIRADRQAEIDKVKTLDDLRKLVVGQGIGWGDVAIYNGNGIIVTTANYENLFPMAAAGRFDLFPRGVNEVFGEHERYLPANPDLSIEQGLVIHYQWPYYFFTGRKDAVLAERIAKGLNGMLADGSFNTVFNRFNAAAIERANLKSRRIIRIRNPSLPIDTPIGSGSIQPQGPAPEKARK